MTEQNHPLTPPPPFTLCRKQETARAVLVFASKCQCQKFLIVMSVNLKTKTNQSIEIIKIYKH